MIKGIVKKIVGSRHGREVRRLSPLVDEINGHYEGLADLSRAELMAKTDEFRGRIAEYTADTQNRIEAARERKRTSTDPDERETLGLRIGKLEEEYHDQLAEVLEELLPEAFAVVKEACRRLMGTEVRVTGQQLVWDMIPYDVQLIGAAQLHLGRACDCTTPERRNAGPHTTPTSPTAPTTSSASTTCATTWCIRSSSGSSGPITLLSSTRWTRS